MKYKFIRTIVNARLFGTGVHLDAQGRGKISYKKRPIWGIKSFLKMLSNKIFDELVVSLPEQEQEFQANHLEKPILKILRKLKTPIEFYQKQIRIFKGTPAAWNSMDYEQKSGMYINALFMAIEDGNTDLVEKSLMKSFGNDISLNIRLGDFGFVARAHIYCKLANRYLFYRGFTNLCKRTLKSLKQEFEEQFLEKTKVIPDKEQDSRTSEDLQGLSGNNLVMVRKLQTENSPTEILKAIEYVQANKILPAIDNLEYLLGHPSEEIQDKALEAVMKLKGL